MLHLLVHFINRQYKTQFDICLYLPILFVLHSEPCPSGSGQSTVWAPQCISCLKNYYLDTVCQPCPNNTCTIAAGSVGRDQCQGTIVRHTGERSFQLLYADSEVPDQHAHPHSLSQNFTVCYNVAYDQDDL